jgi:hypothetical protein
MVELGIGDAGPMAAGVGLIALGLIVITGGILLELVAGGGQGGLGFLAWGALCLGGGVYLVWLVSTTRDRG